MSDYRYFPDQCKSFFSSRDIFHISLSRFTRQTNSAKLGRPSQGVKHRSHRHGKSIQFGPIKHHQIFQAKETDALVRPRRKSSTRTSTSTSPISREQQKQMTVLMMKINPNIPVPLLDTPNLIRRYTTDRKSSYSKNRLLWRSKPQITL